MKRAATVAALAAGILAAGPAWAQVPRCAKDMSRAGSICMDLYEASVWSIPSTETGLIKKVQKGRADLADLSGGGATQLGVGIVDDYAPCNDNGTGCSDIYAVSIAGVLPSANITWFQAQQACANSQKRLPRSGEWQQAVNGTPDPGGDDGTTDCNTNLLGPLAAVNTGSRSGCVSRFGNYDMVGNLYEWVEDWVPASTACLGWGAFSGDDMCLSGASTTATAPGALLRGGHFLSGSTAGPLTVDGSVNPSFSNAGMGFRCGR